jgi:hypothetical protein
LKRRQFCTSGETAKVAGRHITGIRAAVHGARADGAWKLHGGLSRHQLRTVGADAGSAGLPRFGGAAIGLDPDQVKVNVTLMGGGFGRRLEHDYAVEAALVSKAINGPVKVIWTREDDMRFSTYRPASCISCSAQSWMDPDSRLTHRIIAPSISGQKGQPTPGGVDPDLPDEAGPSTAFPITRSNTW